METAVRKMMRVRTTMKKVMDRMMMTKTRRVRTTVVRVRTTMKKGDERDWESGQNDDDDDEGYRYRRPRRPCAQVNGYSC
jgi:hypothetical protein